MSTVYSDLVKELANATGEVKSHLPTYFQKEGDDGLLHKMFYKYRNLHGCNSKPDDEDFIDGFYDDLAQSIINVMFSLRVIAYQKGVDVFDGAVAVDLIPNTMGDTDLTKLLVYLFSQCGTVSQW